MSDKEPCCRLLVAGAPSPFDVVTLGYYDGATSGVVKCRGCGRAYAFSLLGWDEGQDVRIFGLSGIGSDAFERIRCINAAPLPPAGVRTRADELTLAVRDAMAGSFTVDLVIATLNLAREIVAVREVGFNEWAALLGLRP